MTSIIGESKNIIGKSKNIIGESKSIIVKHNGSKFWESENRIISRGLSIIYQGLIMNASNISQFVLLTKSFGLVITMHTTISQGNSFVALNSTNTYCYAYQKYTGVVIQLVPPSKCPLGHSALVQDVPQTVPGGHSTLGLTVPS